MLFKSALISTLLLASTVLADRRYQHRRSLNHHTNIVSRATTETLKGAAGAKFASNDISSASTTFKVPQAAADSGSAIFSLGLDLSPNCNNYFMGGLIVNEPGYPTYLGFGMFQTDADPTIYNTTFSAGDEVTFTVTAHSKNAGEFTIVNENHSETHSFQSTDSLCLSSMTVALGANSDGNNGYLPLLNFGQVTFTDTQLTTTSGTISIDKINSQDVTLINMELNDKVVATTTISNGDVVVKQQ